MVASSFLASFYFICGAVLFFVAITILRYSTRDIVGWATALVLLFSGTGPLIGAMGVILKSNLHEGAFLFRSLIDSFNYIWEFFFPSLVLFALVYPVEHKLWKHFRKFLIILFVPHFFHLILVIFLIDRINPADSFSFLQNISFLPDTLSSYLDKIAGILGVLTGMFFKAHTKLFSTVNISYAAFAMVLLGRSRRLELTPRVKRQASFVIVGLGVSVLTYSVARVIPIFWGGGAEAELSVAFINASLVIGGGTIAYVIVRYRFLGMKLIARKGIFIGGVTAILVSVYLIIVKQLTSYIRGFSDISIEVLEIGLIVIFIIIFQPLVVKIEEWVENISFGEGKSPRERIKTLSSELLSIVDADSMKRTINEVLSDIFEATRPDIILRDGICAIVREDNLETMERVFTGAREPIGKLDFIEAMGFERPKRRMFLPPSERDIAAVVNNLPAGIKWLAGFEMIVPVIRSGECSALLLLGEHEQRGHYSVEEIALFSMLASQIAAALSRIELLEEVVEKRVMEEELGIARRIQQDLLPSHAPYLERYEVAAVSIPSKQVGGDYFDYITRDGLFAFAVADVAGKGVPASLLMASLQASLRSMKGRIDDPVAVVSSLNEAMFDITSDDKFATLFYGCIDIKKNKLFYSNAGHFFPSIIRADGEIEELDYSGLVLGVKPDFEYESLKLKFKPGDTLVVTTDGILEAENEDGEFYGEKKLLGFLTELSGRSPDEIKNAIIKDVKGFSAHDRARDDMTILVLKRNR
ncbi:SpoIIE family protein phosphatase [bacterium]|nr:SpoIIE family protein phosphatase [bacterium]